MSYELYFETGVSRDGARYVARFNGEYCGAYHCEKAAKGAIRLKERVEKAALELDRAARPHFCDGRYGVWRAIERGERLPVGIERAFDAHHKASMALNAYMGRA